MDLRDALGPQQLGLCRCAPPPLDVGSGWLCPDAVVVSMDVAYVFPSIVGDAVLYERPRAAPPLQLCGCGCAISFKRGGWFAL